MPRRSIVSRAARLPGVTRIVLGMTERSVEAGSTKPALAQIPSGVKDAAVCAALLAFVFWYGAGWLRAGIPPGDFPGTVANLQAAVNSGSSGVLAQWTDGWFCGTVTAALTSNFLWVASFLPFTKLGDCTTAVKVGSLFYLWLAAIGMYLFLRMLLRHRWASLVGAAIYPIHPIAISTAVSTGHVNFAPLYAITPFVFAAALAYARRPSVANLFWFAGLDCVLLWVDNERGTITTLFVLAFFALMRYDALRRSDSSVPLGGIARSIAGRAGAFALFTAWAAAGIAVPAYLASRHLALFTEVEKMSAINAFGLNNPLYLVDRGGYVLMEVARVLPGSFVTVKSAYLYLGTSTLIACVAATITARKASQRRVAWFASLSALMAVWLTAGVYSLAGGMFVSMKMIAARAPQALIGNASFWTQVVLLAALAVLSVWLGLRRRSRRRGRALAVALWCVAALAVCAFLFIRPFMLLHRIPMVFGQIRSPAWFMACICPFALACGAAVFVSVLAGRIRQPVFRDLAAIVLLGAFLLDFAPYRRAFDIRDGSKTGEFAGQAIRFLSESPLDGRALAAAAYSPLNDMVISAAGRENAWGWLVWTSPPGLKTFILGSTYPDLYYNSARGAALAGIADIRYLVSYKANDDFRSSTPLLRQVGTWGALTIYENAAWRPFVQPYNPSTIDWTPDRMDVPAPASDVRTELAERKPGRITVKTSAQHPALLVLSESFFPGWSCSVDGTPAPLEAFGGAFLCTQVPAGNHVVSLRYHAPRVYYVAYATSGLFVLSALAVAIGAILRILRTKNASAAA